MLSHLLRSTKSTLAMPLHFRFCRLSDLAQQHRPFHHRHNGPSSEEVQHMLQVVGHSSLADLMESILPPQVLDHHALAQPSDALPDQGMSEQDYLSEFDQAMSLNKHRHLNFLGQGYYGCVTPSVIKRGMLENPKWYTKYTPYQSEIAQGNLEALINYQTTVSELTGLPVSNASLLDEATAAAEAMQLSYNSFGGKRKVYLVDQRVFPSTLQVLSTRAYHLGVTLLTTDVFSHSLDDSICGLLVQSPDNLGIIHEYSLVTHQAKQHKIICAVATDLLALTQHRTPAEQGFDIALGNSQRLGVPMGYGGPHAGFFVCSEEHKRKMPGKIIGVSKDKNGNDKVYRLALTTREQHIRREKATSNICTSQVLLANMAGMYAVYHGPQGLSQIAKTIRALAQILRYNLEQLDYQLIAGEYFDTVVINTQEYTHDIVAMMNHHNINVRNIDGQMVGISIDETHSLSHVSTLINLFASHLNRAHILQSDHPYQAPLHPRSSPFMLQPVFHQHNTETNLMRYLDHLASKDISLTNSMMSLGSCTMKLNSAAQLQALSWPTLNLHPFVPVEQAQGYSWLFSQLTAQLKAITQFDAFSLMPNSGASGEYTGLTTILAYHRSIDQSQRNVCLIPQSAHGTNPASATMSGMKVQVVRSDAHGSLDLDHLQQLVNQYSNTLAALMLTYPSTHGVYEQTVTEAIRMVHQAGGQVYMDGANMNAQVGWTSPGYLQADVCHLNLHKTFAIPHGGGGPGMGPIGVKAHLAPFLPNHPVTDLNVIQPHDSARIPNGTLLRTVAGAAWGSASILSISHAYIKMMGVQGLKQATALAILSANYLRVKLQNAYPVLYSTSGCAHEFIIDLRPLKQQSGITEEDIAKRLMDYGFHAPTMSFPVAGTLMIEPTESEDLAELNKFISSMLSIRSEIELVINGTLPKDNNPLKNAPHSHLMVSSDDWPFPYSRSTAAYPLPWLKNKKYWPPIGRVDNVYGDKNLRCTCPSVDEYV